jgi:hypothetical protein
MRLAAKRVQFACNWLPLGYKLYGPPVTHMRSLHALAASCVQSRQFFASTLREQVFELKMKTPLKNLRIYATYGLAKAYPLTLCMARSNLFEANTYWRNNIYWGSIPNLQDYLKNAFGLFLQNVSANKQIILEY